LEISSVTNTPKAVPYDLAEVVAKVKAVIADTGGIDPAKISDEALFIEDLGIDSLSAVEIIFDIEKAFGVTFPEDEARSIRCLKDVRELVVARLDAAAPPA
jgi:acyl carrier protein